MRRIEKTSREPPELLAYRKTLGERPVGPGAYEDFGEKEALKRQLVADQRGLCCYCMRRVTADDGRVEHHASQARHGDRALDWSNMLLACSLTEGQRPPHQTCDVRKGDADIRINPLNDSVDRIRYGFTGGTVQIDDAEMQLDIDVRLNLNIASLQRYRRDDLDGFMDGLKRKLGAKGNWTRRKLESELSLIRAETPLRPFTGLLEAYLARLIRTRS